MYLLTLPLYVSTHPASVGVAALYVDSLVVYDVLIHIMHVATITAMVAIWHGAVKDILF